MAQKHAKDEVGSRLVSALGELRDTLAAGKRPSEVFSSRTYKVPAPPAFSPVQIQKLRRKIGVSQAVFASMLGTSVPLVQGWEQGKRAPHPMARRLLQQVARDPARWRDMVVVRA